MYQSLVVLMLVTGMMCVVPCFKRWVPKKWHRCLLSTIFLAYLAGYLYFTLLSRVPGSGATWNFNPLKAYQKLSFEIQRPLEGQVTGLAFTFLSTYTAYDGILLNVLLYCPMGYLLPDVAPKGVRVMWSCMAASIATELLQGFLKLGWCDVNDLIHNMLGAWIGLTVYRVCRPTGDCDQDVLES